MPKNREYKEESVDCPICKCDYSEVALEKMAIRDNDNIKTKSGDHILHNTHRLCLKCGTIYISPRMTSDSLELFYAGNDKGTYLEHLKEFDLNYVLLRHLESKWRIENLKTKFIKKNMNVLAVGSGIGWFAHFVLQMGANCVALEPNERLVRGARNFFGVDSIKSTIAKFQPSEKYDIITLNHVLEHLAEPGLAIDKFRNALSNNGFLYVEVPDSLRPWRRMASFFHDHHITTFNNVTLVKWLETRGLTVVKSGHTIHNFFFVLCKKAKKSCAINNKAGLAKLVKDTIYKQFTVENYVSQASELGHKESVKLLLEASKILQWICTPQETLVYKYKRIGMFEEAKEIAFSTLNHTPDKELIKALFDIPNAIRKCPKHIKNMLVMFLSAQKDLELARDFRDKSFSIVQ